MDTQTPLSAFTRGVSSPLEGTQSAQNAIARVKYSHDAMIDLIIAQPAIKQNEIAKHFGYTPAWVSRIMNSDAFLQRLAARKADLVDPAIFLNVDEKLRAVAQRSLDVVLEKLELPGVGFDQALDAANLATKALGYGARQQNVNLQQNFVVAMPQKAEDAQSWANKYAGPSPRLQAMVQEVADAREIPSGENDA